MMRGKRKPALQILFLLLIYISPYRIPFKEAMKLSVAALRAQLINWEYPLEIHFYTMCLKVSVFS